MKAIPKRFLMYAALCAFLVCLILSLFLRMMVAGWVLVGIPIAFFRRHVANAARTLAGVHKHDQPVRFHSRAGHRCG